MTLNPQWLDTGKAQARWDHTLVLSLGGAHDPILLTNREGTYREAIMPVRVAS